MTEDERCKHLLKFVQSSFGKEIATMVAEAFARRGLRCGTEQELLDLLPNRHFAKHVTDPDGSGVVCPKIYPKNASAVKRLDAIITNAFLDHCHPDLLLIWREVESAADIRFKVLVVGQERVYAGWLECGKAASGSHGRRVDRRPRN